MAHSAKRSLAFILLFLFTASAVLCLFSRPARADGSDEETVYRETQQLVVTMMFTKEKAVYGNEWLAMDLNRDGQYCSPYYLKSLIDTIIEKDGILHTGAGNYTNYAKVVLVLSSYGIDATNVAGFNLVKKVSDFPQVVRQGINGVIYALLALDSNHYEVQPPEDVDTDINRDTYINAILNNQLEDGGWDWAGQKADPDMTAMAIQALAPYYDSNENVKASVDKALATLSNLQQPDGGFNTEDAAYKESSESTSMVILALTALGINPDTDERFIKNGYTTIDNLCSFAVPGGGFKHTADGAYNGLATDQGYRALSAYHRLLNGQTSMYDMTDLGEYAVADSSLYEQVQVTYYDDWSVVQDDVDLIENSDAVKSIKGKIDCLFDLEPVLSTNSGSVTLLLPELETAHNVTVVLSEEALDRLGETVFVIGIHNGSFVTIAPESVNRTSGEVVFTVSVCSTFSVASGVKASPVDPTPDTPTKPSNVPNTGDNSGYLLWIGLIAAALICISAAVVLRSRKNHLNKNS